MKVRRSLAVIEPIAAQMVAHFTAQGLFCEVGGSFRRRAPLVGDLDIVVRCADLQSIVLPDCVMWQKHGAQVAQGTMLMADGSGLTVDVWGATDKQWGAFMWFVTGSKELNVMMRRMAQEQGLKLSQFGLFRDGVQIDDGTEEGVAACLGMDWISPQDRQKFAPPLVVSQEFFVTSSKGVGEYRVTRTDDDWQCSCPHFRYKRVECKHIKQVRTSAQVHATMDA